MLLHTKEYLYEMDKNIDDKLNILKYIRGKNVLDVGCGGGELTRILSSKGFNAYGLDISDAVKDYFMGGPMGRNFIHADARHIDKHVEYGEIDTIIFSSILHEVYSYNKFSYSAVEQALTSAWKILPKGGRIIIRDGIKTDINADRVIQFYDDRDLDILHNYKRDFKGREIKYECLGNGKVRMPINDAMEFLYTYTWGEESYKREVQEQYGIFTPHEYINFIEVALGSGNYDILSFNHYLQDGYNYHLLKKIKFMNRYCTGIERLPDSTFLMVIRKNVD